jgi:hypothetical protein
MRNRKCVIWFMLVAMGTLSIWLGTTPHVNAQSSQPADKSELAKNLIVKITGDNVSGSGIVFGQIKEMLFIVTANHVVRPQNREAQNLRVTFNFWFEEIEATFTGKFDKNLDLAVLLVDLKQSMLSSDVLKEFLPLTQLQYVSDVKAGNKIYPVGHPAGHDWYVPTSPKNIFDVEGERILIEFECNQGFSGGGVFDEQWGLAGMIRAFNPPLCEAISFDRIQEMLKKSRFVVSLKSAPSSLLASPATPTSKPQSQPTPTPTTRPTATPKSKPIPIDYPTRSISNIVYMGAGSLTDMFSRLMAAEMEQILGKSIVVLNKPGHPITAYNDGYTISGVSVPCGTDRVKDLDFMLIAKSPDSKFVAIAIGMNTPEAIKQILYNAFKQAIKKEAVQQFARQKNYIISGKTGEEAKNELARCRN